jgi:hypothetical protein
MATEPYYADYDGLACRFTANEGWVLRDKWEEGYPSDVNHTARILTKEEFDRFFPDAPPLPPEAFKTKA